MPLFKRGRRDDHGAEAAAERAAIDGFWSWWHDNGRVMASASHGVPAEQLAGAMTTAVRAVHPDLEWETAPGTESRHLLTVTAAGVPELRAVARRWRMAAPPADAEWAYTDVRLPATGDIPGLSLRRGDREFAVVEASVDAYVRGMAVDVSVYHPGFADLDEPERDAVAWSLLERVLGEDGVQTWLGEVGSSPLPALDPVPISGLRAVVRDLREQHTAPDGSPRYSVLEGKTPAGAPVVALVALPLRAARAPQLDTYLGLVVPYADRTAEGLPGPGSLDRLRALEDRITEEVGRDGEVVAVQSHEGVRILHVYVDGTTGADERLRSLALTWEQGTVRVETHRDPAWTAVKHLRG